MPEALDCDTAVIGSGAGGLTAALCLARAGQRVLVFEQHYVPGGWCHSFWLDGHCYSPGVHYVGELGPGGRLRRILEGLGLGRDLGFVELNPDGYDHFVIGQERLDVPAGRPRLAERLVERFPHEKAGIERYLELSRLLGLELNAGINHQLGLGPKPGRLEHLPKFALRPLSAVLDELVGDPLLKAMLSVTCGNHGMPPSRAPLAVHVGMAEHFIDGAGYPLGGSYRIPRAFVRGLRRAGGEVRLSAEVAEILSTGLGEARRVVGLRLADGSTVRARHVVSNADPHVTFGKLLDPGTLSRALQRRLRNTGYSISALSLFLALDRDPRSLGFDSGNLWFSTTPDIDALCDPSDVEPGSIRGLFVTATSLKDPARARRGDHTMEAFCLAPFGPFEPFAESHPDRRPAAYLALKARARRRMLELLEAAAPGLARSVILAELGTPLTKAYYTRPTRGAIYGTAKRPDQIGAFAYSARTEIPGLALCGASTVGQGVLGAVLSGLAAAREVLGCGMHELLASGEPALQLVPAAD